MEGYLNLRIAPWLRRLITRLIAIIPAYIVIVLYGESQTGALLVFSQVVLSLQLGFAVIPLIHFTSDKQKMGVFANKAWVKVMAWTIATVIIALNVKLVYNEVSVWITDAGDRAWIIWCTVVPLCMAAGGLLVYITVKPFLERRSIEKAAHMPHGSATTLTDLEKPVYRRIAVCIDFSPIDELAIRSAVAQGGKEAEYLLIHVNESAGAMVYGSDIEDRESSEDRASLHSYLKQLTDLGYHAESEVGFGNPRRRIPEMVEAFNADLLVMGAHGHRFFKDLIFGTTLGTVRHRVKIPVLIVR